MFCAESGKLVEMPVPYVNEPIGQYYDGLLLVYSEFGNNGMEESKYFDSEGNCVIDLDNSNNYYQKILWSSGFHDGTATVRFIGLDGNPYCVTIDKTGNWLDEPEINYNNNLRFDR